MNALIILPNQLFEELDIKKYNITSIYIIEHPVYFTKYTFHKLKLIYHHASMSYYYDYLKKKYNYDVYYVNFYENYKSILKKYNTLYMYDPVDHDIIQEFTKYKNIKFLDSLLFMLTNEDIKEYAKDKKHFVHDDFYKWHRKKAKILLTKNDQPIGNKWSYDYKNRETFPEKYKEQKLKFYDNKYITNACIYINKHFKDNPGDTNLYIPIDHKNAKLHFKMFLKNKYKLFGPYQDAVNTNIIFGNHAVISALLNNGLLSVNYVVKLSEKYGLKYKVPIESIEGFLRQICGWREFVRLLYITKYKELTENNFFDHTRKLKKFWFTNNNTDTGFDIINTLIKKTFKYSYLHHIERLMYIGNFMLLCKIDPKEVFTWFISICSIDAYDWVMVPNIYGMSQFSAGKIMMTRPYIASSNYIDKMSNIHKKNDNTIKLNNKTYNWNIVFDALYYNFINDNQKYLAKNYATAMQVKHWLNKNTQEKREILKIAKEYLQNY